MATRAAASTDYTLGRVGGSFNREADGTYPTAKNLLSLFGLKHEQIAYTAIADDETVSPGSKSILRAAFEPDDSGDDVNVVVTNPSTLTFQVGSGTTHSGVVHIWSRGY